MNQWRMMTTTAVGLLAVMIWLAAPALAEKPPWAGGHKGDDHSHNKKHSDYDDGGQEAPPSKHSGNHGHGHGHDYQEHFGHVNRAPIDEYYAGRFSKGKCPPGLAKKGNGCRPPGQARKWHMHQPLPREVVYHPLPPEVEVHLGPPPSGYRFVRVAQDILMIAVGTGMVVDAMEDIGQTMER